MDQFRDHLGVINLSDIPTLDYKEVNLEVYRFNYGGKHITLKQLV